ncbi:MAG TPA: glycosyltransferase family 9 protein [Cyclobacteriaceae bacterium]|nr:glycosyltransferase family 9 protein [Cyclobacteriaceae bacterium]
MVKISAVIITYNEERNILRCLNSLAGVADEIVVVDSFSKDRTREICYERGVRVVEHPFKSHIDQKNFAVTQASYDIVLSLDADEYLSEELTKCILDVKEKWPDEAYSMNRLSNYGGRWIRHGNWYPDTKIRLWNRRIGLWGGENPHDMVIIKRGIKVRHLKGDILHRAYTDSAETLSKIQNYSEIFARESVGRKSSSVPKIIARSSFAFFKSYILKRGFIDGFEGLMVAMAVSNHVFYKYAKLYEANHRALMGKRLVISRTDNLGDVILTLPLLGYLKSVTPDLKIFFIGKKYTQPVIDRCIFVDQFLDKEEVLNDQNILAMVRADTIIFIFPDQKLAKLASKVGIKHRVATAHRWYNWMYCNHLVGFTRVKSNLHESQLNFKLLKPFKLNGDIDTSELIPYYGLRPAKNDFSELLNKDRFNLIIHPKSKGSAREWPLDNYYRLVLSLPVESYRIFVTGLQAEGDLIRKEKPELLQHPNVTDLTGKLNLEELTSFIAQADGLLACSTGVLHLAAALGIYSLGLFSPMKPIHPGRWMPVGKKAQYLVLKKECSLCRNSKECACINAITVEEVKNKVDSFSGTQFNGVAIPAYLKV